MDEEQNVETQYDRYRRRRNKGFKELFGGFGSILFGAAWAVGMIAIAEFSDAGPPGAFGYAAGLFILGGLIAIIAGIADLIWAFMDDRPRR